MQKIVSQANKCERRKLAGDLRQIREPRPAFQNCKVDGQ